MQSAIDSSMNWNVLPLHFFRRFVVVVHYCWRRLTVLSVDYDSESFRLCPYSVVESIGQLKSPCAYCKIKKKLFQTIAKNKTSRFFTHSTHFVMAFSHQRYKWHHPSTLSSSSLSIASSRQHSEWLHTLRPILVGRLSTFH